MSKVLVMMGSKSDFEIATKALNVLKKFEVPFEAAVSSAHRTPDRTKKIVQETDADIIIAIAGLSAALPGVIAAYTVKPVIGVPVSGHISYDALLSIVQMPPGIPVATVGLDRGDNAAILAVEMLALNDKKLAKKLSDDRKEQAKKVEKDSEIVSSNARGL